MNKNLLKSFRLISIAFIGSVIISISLALILPIIKTHQHFSRLPIALATYDLFDIGVVDVNSDSNLDVFTVNHSAKQSLQLGNGRGEFKDILSDWNLDQDRNFSNLEDSLDEPEFSKPGIYIYRREKNLYIQSHELDRQTISGTLKLSWPVEIEQQQLFDVDLKQQRSPEVETTLNFTAQDNGLLVIKNKEDIIEIPHKFVIDPQVSLENIHIGVKALHPESHIFNLMWRDRHSMAWTDINQDGQLDVFIGRGAVKGQLNLVSDRIDDELMIQRNNTFVDRIELTEMEKKDCPARQSAWVDFDRDNLLDLYLVCGRNDKPLHPNQLWQQQADGKFIDVAPEMELDFPEDGSFRWLDVERDGDLDLLATREKNIELWVNKGDRFERKKIVEKGKAKIMNLAIADWDRDGDLDAYASSKYIEEPNLLLVNDNGSFKAVSPLTVGLPEMGIDGAWTDFNNDGLIDLHLVPQGIYRQLENRRFKATGILDFSRNLNKIANARGVWFDLNNDGARDYLLSAKISPSVLSRFKNKLLPTDNSDNWEKKWQASLYQNTQSSNHWLQIALSGSKENPQGIGTIVEVTTSRGKQLQQVGNTDHSYYSQGHYRLYFGLGKDETVQAIDLKWSDGQIQHLENQKSDRLLVIDKI